MRLAILLLPTLLFADDAYVEVWKWQKHFPPAALHPNPDRTRFYYTQWRPELGRQRICSAATPGATHWTCRDITTHIARSSFAFDEARPARAYAAVGPYVMRTIDNGLTWTRIFTALEDVERIYVSQRNSAIYVFPGSVSGVANVYKSTDDGAVFVPYQVIAVKDLLCWTVIEDPVDGYLYAGYEIWSHPPLYDPPFMRSTDGGQTWTKLSLSNAWHVITLVTARKRAVPGPFPSQHGSVYALQEGAPLNLSTNGGGSWQEVGLLRPSSNLLVNPNWYGMMHVAFTGSTVATSVDWGVHWMYQPVSNENRLPEAIDDKTNKMYVNVYATNPNTSAATFSSFDIGVPSATGPTVKGGTIKAAGLNTYPVNCLGCVFFNGTASLTQGSQSGVVSKTAQQLVFTAPFSGAATLKAGDVSVSVTLIP